MRKTRALLLAAAGLLIALTTPGRGAVRIIPIARSG